MPVGQVDLQLGTTAGQNSELGHRLTLHVATGHKVHFPPGANGRRMMHLSGGQSEQTGAGQAFKVGQGGTGSYCTGGSATKAKVAEIRISNCML